jgi:hypothetical protein
MREASDGRIRYRSIRGGIREVIVDEEFNVQERPDF